MEAARREAARVDSGHPMVRVPKTAELVAANLRRQIVRGELLEGDALPSETELIEQLGVSRPTLREAFRVLESEGLISIRRGSHGGARVHVPNGDVAARYAGLVLEHRGTRLADVYEARAVLEPPCAGMVARRHSSEDLERLRVAIDGAESEGSDPLERIRHQTEFHDLVIELAGNTTVQLLSRMLQRIIATATQSRAVSGNGLNPVEAAHQGALSHRRLLALIEAADEVGAERLWRRHLAETTAFLLEAQGAETVLDLLE